MTRDPTAGIDLACLVADELLACAAQQGKQVSLSGRDVCLQPRAAETYGLAVHELATNALKYGALSRPEGHVRVTWHLANEECEPRLRFRWTETGASVLSRTPSRGLGSELLTRTLPHQIGATTTLSFGPGGLRCPIDLPSRKVLQ